MKEQLAALYALQQQDSLLEALKRQFSLLDSGHREKAVYDAADKANKEALDALHIASGEFRDADLEQQQVEVKRKEYEAKLYGGKVQVPKELQAIQDEINMLIRQRTRLDDKIISLMETVETRKKEQAGTSERARTGKAALKAKIESYRVAADAIRAQAQEIVEHRQSFVKPVPPALLQRYEALKGVKAGVAIVALEDGNACGGCKMALPSSIVTRVHEGAGIEYCQNCGRMICEGEAKVKATAGAK